MKFTFLAPASLVFLLLVGFFCASQEPFQDKDLAASSVTFSPDGKYFAAGGRSAFDTKAPDALDIANSEKGLKGVLKVWETRSGKEIWHVSDPNKKIMALAFSPAGPYLAVSYRRSGIRSFQRENQLIVWDIRTKEKKIAFPACSGYNCLAFSLDGKWLATGSSVHGEETSPRSWFTLWEMPSGKEKYKTKLPGGTELYPQLVDSLAFSPDSSTVAIGTYESDLFVFDVKTKRLAKVFGAGHRDRTRVAFSPDGKFLAFGSDDKETRVFDWGKRDVIAKFSPHDASRAVAFGPDSKTLFTCGIDFDPKKKRDSGCWKAWSVPACRLLFTGKTQNIPACMAISPNGTKLLLGNHGGPVEFVNVPKELQMKSP